MKAQARKIGRHVALDALVLRDRISATTQRNCVEPHVHLLYLHSVPPSEICALRQLIAAVSRGHRLVSYSEAVQLILNGSQEPVAAFSFDDGFASNVQAAGVLDEVGASACFFVPTGFVGCPDIASARAFFGMKDGVDEPAMSWAQLEDLVDRGHEIGNHTISHRVLSDLSHSQLQDEIQGAHEVLSSRLGQGQHFAWPRGRFAHFTSAGARIVFETGHASCASAERGAHAKAPAPMNPCLHRDHVMTSWPLRHNLHFLRRAERNQSAGSWPDGWQP